MEEKLGVTTHSDLPSQDEKLLKKPSFIERVGWGRIIFIILLILVAAGILSYFITPREPAQPTQKPSGMIQKPDWLTYTDNIGDFTLQYPKAYTVSKTGMTSVQVLSPTIPAINTNFRLGIKYKSFIASQTMNELITKNKPCSGITPQGGTHSTLNGKIDAQVYLDTPCGKVTSTVVYTLHKGKLYVITVDSQAKFSEVKPYIDPIIATFEFTQN